MLQNGIRAIFEYFHSLSGALTDFASLGGERTGELLV
jgi:hypothetical protein